MTTIFRVGATCLALSLLVLTPSCKKEKTVEPAAATTEEGEGEGVTAEFS